MSFSISRGVYSIKKLLVDLEGRVKRSEFYFTNIETNERVQLSRTPESVNARFEANFRTFNIIERGEVKLPKGERLAQISWKGVLPGAGILLYTNNITHAAWEKPNEIIKVFKRWREEGAKLKLLVTQTPLNIDVYLKSFNWEASGGLGDYKYSIDLIAAKDMKVMTVKEADEARAKAKEDKQNAIRQRTAMKSRAGIFTSQINNVWGAAQLLTGQGSNWEALANLTGQNKDPTDISNSDAMSGGLIIWG